MHFDNEINIKLSINTFIFVKQQLAEKILL